MSGAIGIWLMVGLAAGTIHAWMIWRMAQPPYHSAAWHHPRLLLVGAVLFVSAVSGQLLPTFAGWVMAYAMAVGVVGMRRTS